jgi:hypothetical protein
MFSDVSVSIAVTVFRSVGFGAIKSSYIDLARGTQSQKPWLDETEEWGVIQ